MKASRAIALSATVIIAIAITITSALIINPNRTKLAEQQTLIWESTVEKILANIDLSKVYYGLPVDAIPPLFFPKYLKASQANWLLQNDQVIGVSIDGDSRAYPFVILNYHEIVNEKIGGRNILVSYCPLCRSGLVFEREVDGETLTFGNSGALYESNLVMYDRETNSLWWQIAGIAIKGEMRGKSLRIIPSVVTTWEEWKKLHPDTLVLSLDTGYKRPYLEKNFTFKYDRDLFTEPGYPHSKPDPRLAPKAKVVGVALNGEKKAYSITDLGDAVINDEVGGVQIVVFIDAESQAGAAYERQVDGEKLDFSQLAGKIVDKNTGSTWNIGGRSTEGKLEGKQLTQVAAWYTYWFAWAIAFPDTAVMKNFADDY